MISSFPPEADFSWISNKLFSWNKILENLIIFGERIRLDCIDISGYLFFRRNQRFRAVRRMFYDFYIYIKMIDGHD